MTNARNGRKANRRQVRRRNPMTRNAGVGAPRNRLNFDGQVFRGIHHLPIVTTGATNTVFSVHSIDVQSNANAIITNYASMMNFYKEYKVMALTLEWIPAVAPGVADAGSEILIGTTWNPEQIVSYQSGVGTPGTQIGIMRSDRTVRSFNAWERFSYTVPIHQRRKLFDVDVNPGSYLTNVDIVDRTVQGAIIVGAQSVNASVSLGHFLVRPVIMLSGLGVKST